MNEKTTKGTPLDLALFYCLAKDPWLTIPTPYAKTIQYLILNGGVISKPVAIETQKHPALSIWVSTCVLHKNLQPLNFPEVIKNIIVAYTVSPKVSKEFYVSCLKRS